MRLNYILLTEPSGAYFQKPVVTLLPCNHLFHWLSTKGVHADRSLGAIYKNFIFLQDLFDPAYALLINSAPYTSYARLLAVYEFLFKNYQTATYYWSHYYREEMPVGVAVIEDYVTELKAVAEQIRALMPPLTTPGHKIFSDLIETIMENEPLLKAILILLKTNTNLISEIQRKYKDFLKVSTKPNVMIKFIPERELILLEFIENETNYHVSFSFYIFRALVKISTLLLNLMRYHYQQGQQGEP